MCGTFVREWEAKGFGRARIQHILRAWVLSSFCFFCGFYSRFVMFGVLVSIIGETNVPVDTPEMANRNRQTANSFSKELWRDILMGQHGQSQAQRSIGAHSHAIDASIMFNVHE